MSKKIKSLVHVIGLHFQAGFVQPVKWAFATDIIILKFSPYSFAQNAFLSQGLEIPAAPHQPSQKIKEAYLYFPTRAHEYFPNINNSQNELKSCKYGRYGFNLTFKAYIFGGCDASCFIFACLSR